MRTCPQCASTSAWLLGDGRHKCQTCGIRYSWTSVWSSVRLPEAARQSLLDAFVAGVPASRRETAPDVCVDTRERFYRLARACCARHIAASTEVPEIIACPPASHSTARGSMRGWATCRSVMVLGVVERTGRVQIVPPRGGGAEILSLLRARTAVGGVLQLPDGRAYASLKVEGDCLIVPRAARAALAMSPAEAFWQYARSHLQTFRKIAVRFSPLYFAEVCFRFSHRDQDLAAILGDLMHAESVTDIAALLKAGRSRLTPAERAPIASHDGDTALREARA